MRQLMVGVLALVLSAALWSAAPPTASATSDEHEILDRPGCQAGPVFVPGYSVGPVSIGAPVDAVVRWLGRPLQIQNRTFQGNQWTRLAYAGLNVLARNNSVVALTLPQGASVPVRTSCGTVVPRTYTLAAGNVLQTYGAPAAKITVNGQQYWLYNAQGLLLTLPAAGNVVQGLTVYPAGEYCAVVPMFVSLFGFSINVGNTTQCTAVGAYPPRESTEIR